MFIYPNTLESLSLPIWLASDRPLYTPSTIEEIAADPNKTTAIRAIRLKTEGIFDGGITEVLSTADKELKRVAEVCGSLIVDYTWGLYGMQSEELDDEIAACVHEYREFGIPSNHVLAAEVEVITDGRPVHVNDDDLFRSITKNVNYYKRTSNGHYLADMSANQFMESSSREDMYMVDIDLLLGFKLAD